MNIYFDYFLRFIESEEDSLGPICDQVNEWIRLGAKYVGGCCNVGSKDIKKIKERINV